MSHQLHSVVRTSDSTSPLVEVLAKQQHVLIVGTKHGNLPQWMVDHPLIEQWASDGTEVERATVIPSHVGAVLFFRWISHKNHKRIRAMAQAERVYAHPELLGTGEVRRLLNALLPVDAPAEGPAPWHGTLQEFVHEHVIIGDSHGHQSAEAKRLLAYATAAGLQTTLSTVISAVNREHRTAERERTIAQLAADAPFTVIETPPATDAPFTVIETPRPVTTMDATLAELIRMLDDAVAVLGLAREQLILLSTKNAALQSSQATLRERVVQLFAEGV